MGAMAPMEMARLTIVAERYYPKSDFWVLGISRKMAIWATKAY